MSQYPPRDYPATSVSSRMTADDAKDVSLGSIKERLDAKKPVSSEMINDAVNNLFTADSHDTYRRSTPKQLNPQSSLRNWLKKPAK